MSQRIERQRAFLHFLWTTDETQRKKIIGMASEDQLKAFREITLNKYLHGTFDCFRLLQDKTREV